MGDAEGPGHKESEVQKLLHFPKKWEERPEAWERMTGKRVLFALLSKEVAVVRDVTFWKQARQLLATWKADFVDPPASCDIDQSVRTARKEAYDTAERLLACAQEAARIAGSDGGHLPRFDGWEAPG